MTSLGARCVCGHWGGHHSLINAMPCPACDCAEFRPVPVHPTREIPVGLIVWVWPTTAGGWGRMTVLLGWN